MAENKRLPIILMIALICMLLFASCAPNPEDGENGITENVATPYESDGPESPMVSESDAPEDDLITYDPSQLGDLPSYSDEKLIRYAAGSDGAYSEAAGVELYRRFVNAPANFLATIAEQEPEAQESACALIAGEAIIGEHDAEFEPLLEGLEGLDEAEQETFDLLKAKYELCKSINR